MNMSSDAVSAILSSIDGVRSDVNDVREISRETLSYVIDHGERISAIEAWQEETKKRISRELNPMAELAKENKRQRELQIAKEEERSRSREDKKMISGLFTPTNIRFLVYALIAIGAVLAGFVG